MPRCSDAASFLRRTPPLLLLLPRRRPALCSRFSSPSLSGDPLPPFCRPPVPTRALCSAYICMHACTRCYVSAHVCATRATPVHASRRCTCVRITRVQLHRAPYSFPRSRPARRACRENFVGTRSSPLIAPPLSRRCWSRGFPQGRPEESRGTTTSIHVRDSVAD